MLRNRRPTPADKCGIIDAAPASLGGRKPEERQRASPGGRNPVEERRPSPAGKRGRMDAVLALLGGQNPEEQPTGARNIIDASPASLGGKTPGKTRPRSNQIQGQRQHPSSKGAVGKTTRIMGTTRIMDTEGHGHSMDHETNKEDAQPPRVRRTNQAYQNPEHKKTTTTKKNMPNLQG